jgi:hypothetical protein
MAALLRPISVVAARAAISSSASGVRFLHSFAAPLAPFAAPLASSAPARPPTTLGHMHAPPPIATDSASFAALRARGNAFVDKSSAIADFLVGDAGMHRRSRAFFARPRKFGKSLTLDVAATMLAAGELQCGLRPKTLKVRPKTMKSCNFFKKTELKHNFLHRVRAVKSSICLLNFSVTRIFHRRVGPGMDYYNRTTSTFLGGRGSEPLGARVQLILTPYTFSLLLLA